MTTASLNDIQLKAARHVEGPLLVLAGAGSGKTRIVTHRIMHLLSLGTPASEILGLTFTNKAAEEMQHRVKTLTQQHVVISTFHSLGARILRESIHEIGYKSNFTIYDDDDSNSLIKQCVKSLGYKEDNSVIKSIISGISQAKNALLFPHQIEKPSFASHGFQLLKEIYSLYQDKLKEYNALDFDDLLFLTVHLLRSSEKAREYYQKRWSFILIDEYQDTNTAQYTLTRILVNSHHNLFVVGDPDQSIYSWRGANIHNILNFKEDFPKATIIKLEQNYRSTNHILSAANHLIGHNQNRYEKNLWSALGNGNKVTVHLCENEHEESDYVLKAILKHYKEGSSLSNMVIFYRTNSQSRIFEDAFLRAKIPYVIVGGVSFYQRREIKDLLAYLKIAVSDFDFLSFTRTINLPKRGLGASFLTKLKTLSESRGESILEICNLIISYPDRFPDCHLSLKQLVSLKHYLEIIHRIKLRSNAHMPLKDLIKDTIESSGYLEYLKEDPESFEERKSNLDELIRKAADWEMERSSTSLQAFLEELTLRSSMDDAPYEKQAVKLMTLHNSKGLEFEIVIIIGLEEDLLPHINCKDSPENLEEERRLCYVGMTRAKEHLYLTGSKYRLMWGTPRIMSPSRFLSELSKDDVLWENQEHDIDDISSSMFKTGSRVLHKDFGEGIIKKCYQTSLGETFDVYFPNQHITRSLVGKFAKLKLL